MADSPKPAGAKKALSAVLTECFNRWKDAIGALAAVLVAAINLMNYISSRWPIITFLITVITWFIALRIITARTNDRREAISEEHAYRDVPRTQAKYVVIALPVVTAIGFMIYTSTITAFGAAIVQSFSYLFAQVLVIALVLAAYVWAFALRTVTAKKQLDQTAKALRGYMYSDEERRVAKWFAIGVPSIIILGLTAYFAWPSIFWPSNRVVLATAEFNELRSISDDKSISSDCDVGAALAEALESSTSGTGYPIMVEHFHYAVPGYGYNAHSWARLYAYLSRSQVVIYGHYWKATGGEVYVQPKVSLITNFDNRLHHTSNIEAVALPIITVKGDQLCTPDPNILVAKQLKPLSLLLIGLATYQNQRYYDAIQALEHAQSVATNGTSGTDKNVYSRQIYFLLAHSYEAVGNEPLREQYLKKASDEGDAEAESDLGYVAKEQHRFRDAEKHFRHALIRDPRLVSARFQLAQIEYSQGRTREARRDFADVTMVNVDEHDVGALNWQADARWNLDDFGGALEEYKRAAAAAHSPDYDRDYAEKLHEVISRRLAPVVRISTATLAQLQSDEYDRAIELSATFDPIPYCWAKANALGIDSLRSDRAKLCLNAPHLVPHDAEGTLDKADMLAKLRRYNDALAEYVVARDFGRDNVAPAEFGIAYCKFMMGKRASAETHLDRAMHQARYVGDLYHIYWQLQHYDDASRAILMSACALDGHRCGLIDVSMRNIKEGLHALTALPEKRRVSQRPL